MPLHGKIVVIKRSGGDGTEFPLTATCLFGRKPDCDIRIQLPQVSKEHCRIDFNENKEVILTNLSSVNPTRVNGEVLQQSDRLKHGDVITIIDRSFRFEYPPAPTPKKRSSAGGKSDTLKVLQDQQVVDTFTAETGEKRISEVFTDGTNHDNIQRSLEKTMELESKEDGSLLQTKTSSPFNDLYQMIKKSLDVKTPSASILQTPTSRFCTPKPSSVRKNVISTEDKGTPKKEVESTNNGTPKSVKKQRRSLQVPPETAGPSAEDAELATKSEATSPQKRSRSAPQRFTACEVIEQVSPQMPKSPVRRRSKEATPASPAVTKDQKEQAMSASKTEKRRTSPRNSGKAEKVKVASKKRKSGELAADLPSSQMKRKRVSFGGFLSPELFDKRLPPDSPLRKGATPRRSLCLSKPTQSLLRRASVIGLLQEFEQDDTNVKSPAKKKTPSPKKSSTAKKASPKTPTPGKKSPKSKSPSPKAESPAKKSPRSRSPSPKAASPGKKSPSPGKKTPQSKTPSPAKKTGTPKTSERPKTAKKSSPQEASRTPKVSTVAVTPAKTPLNSGVMTPTVQGRFSVSRISTPSPVAEEAVINQTTAALVTPKIPLRRKSMKSTSRKTPSLAKSAAKVMLRRSGISRASMKGKNSWADIVKFGHTKAQVAAAAKQVITKKTTKKAVSKPQTPARKLKGHVSTGHADSPVTIVVGKAHKQKVDYPTGAAPRVVTNIALLKKNMKMDEDLTGLSEMFKTPVNERKSRVVIDNNSSTETPVAALGTSVVEPSVLNTPEEPGEMMVSPLTVASAVKGRRYNSEAVQRLLNEDEQSSFVSEIPAMESYSEQLYTDVDTAPVKTPKQKPKQPECLTGVKRIMKTPKQKAEPVEDLRGKLLKTPKQKLEQQECLTGVKRIMKTPKQKAEPVEDLRGKILKTPKQKPEQQECLTGVKRIMKTPRQKAEPIEDIRGNLLVTPKQKPEQPECLTGVKIIFKTPQQETEPLENLEEKLKTPKALEASDVSQDGVEEPQETPADIEEFETTDMKIPKEKSAPVEDMIGVKRLMKTPKEKAQPVEENFGIKTLMKSPRLRGIAPVEDFDGLQELMAEPLTDPSGQMEINEVKDQTPPDCFEDVAKELDFAYGEPRDDMPSDVTDDVPRVDVAEEADANEVVVPRVEVVPSGHDNESSDAMETISQAAVVQSLPVEQPKMEAGDETVSEEQPEVETAAGKDTEVDAAAMDPDHERNSVQGRKTKIVRSMATEDKQEATDLSEDPAPLAPVRGRRGRKIEAAAPSTVRQTTRNRSKDVEVMMEESAPQPSKVALKPKRGRNTKKASDDQSETVQEVVTEAEMVPEVESTQISPVDVDPKANNSTALEEKADSKPKRGRKTKQASEPSPSIPEQQDVSCAPSDTVPPTDMEKDSNGVHGKQLEVVAIENDENKSSETTPQVPVTESSPEMANEIDAASPVQKKSVRGRRMKTVESKAAEEKQEAVDPSEDAAVPAPARGRRVRKTEAAAPPAVRQTARTRNAKSQANTSDNKPEIVPEKSVETEISNDNECSPPVEEPVLKPIRGRKPKQTPVEPPQPEPEKSEDHEQSIAGKPRRGRKTKSDTVEQDEVAEDTSVTVETKPQSQPLARAKRGRNAKQEEEKQENDGKTTSTKIPESQEPVKRLKRSRKAEQDHVEPSEEEIQTVEIVVPEEAESSPDAEPVMMNQQATVAAKPRRGGRKAKQDTQSEPPVESTEVQEVPAISATDKPKRGRRAKQVTDEIGVPAEITAETPELEAGEKKDAEPDVPVVKPSRARGVKTSLKNEVSQAAPAKRACRRAAPPLKETNTESTVMVSESAPSSVEPVKRGRRVAAKPTTDDAMVSNDQAGPSEDFSSAVIEDSKTTKRSVKWKTEPDVFHIPKVTPMKAVRGRKSKLGGQVEAESKDASKAANKTEETDLSDEAVQTQPAKRARRGAKVADEADPKQGAEAETQPKTRRGRSAKK